MVYTFTMKTSRRNILQLFFPSVLALYCMPIAWAKRAPVPKVEPVVHEGTKYVAPNDKGLVGYVQAWDVESGKLLWEKTVFKIRKSPFKTECRQQVYINRLEMRRDSLLISDERDRHFALDLATLKVKKIRKS